MAQIESGSSNRKGRRTGTRTVTFALAFSVAAFVASGATYGAKPFPALNGALCAQIGGAWTTNTCTIPAESTSGAVSSDLRISNAVTLDIKGALTINAGATLANEKGGNIIVENVGGLSTSFDGPSWQAGILVLGTLANAGTITIENVTPSTEGITVSVSVSPNDPSDPNPYTVVPGVLTNSGTITIQNQDQTRGIKNLGTLANSATGTITVANTVGVSVGIYNRRDNHLMPGYYYVDGTMTNAGSIQISNSGKNVNGQFGYGVYNGGIITTTGTFAINASSSGDLATDDAGGFYNSGSFTNYGTLINNRGKLADGETAQLGSFNNQGTMINYGTTYVGSAQTPNTGMFVNYSGSSIMINLGKIINYGGLGDATVESTMMNYGTIYNYGGIGGGTNRGICIDEELVSPGAGTCYSSGD